MKRFFCLFALVLLLSPCALADAYIKVNTYDLPVKSHYSVVIDGTVSYGKDGRVFDFDSLCIDLYLTESEDTAYLQIFSVTDRLIHNTGMTKVSVYREGNRAYFAASDGLYVIGEYDESDIWIDYRGLSFRLRPVYDFSPYSDWK